jgi:hypothetical protein
MYRNIGGIAPVMSAPGYEEFRVAPIPCDAIKFSNCTIDTQFGKTTLNWNINDKGDFEAELLVPFGARATLEFPKSKRSEVFCNGELLTGDQTLEYGKYEFLVTNPQIISI